MKSLVVATDNYPGFVAGGKLIIPGAGSDLWSVGQCVSVVRPGALGTRLFVARVVRVQHLAGDYYQYTFKREAEEE